VGKYENNTIVKLYATKRAATEATFLAALEYILKEGK
jgi:hypothetical protein